MTKKKKTTTNPPNLEEIPEVPTAAVRLDAAIKAKAHSLIENAVEEMWRFVEEPDKNEFDPETLDLLGRLEIGKPGATLEAGLVGPLLQALDREMRSKVRIKSAVRPRTPTATVNKRTVVVSSGGDESKPHDPDLMAERMLKAFHR